MGAKVSYPDPFPNDGMGTANAFESLLSCAHELGLSVHLTDPFYDIDVASDLGQLADELQHMPGKALRTAKWLSEWSRASLKKSFYDAHSSALPALSPVAEDLFAR
jgi:hypothetical protein